MIDVVCALPSRGLVHSRTEESVYRSLQHANVSWQRVYTHNYPIPNSHNHAIRNALEYDPRWIWLVEEDVSPPTEALAKLLATIEAQKADVVTGWYLLSGGTPSFMTNSRGELLFAGTGCMLASAGVFSKLPTPWFQVGTSYTIEDDMLKPKMQETAAYGGHDVDFYYRLRKHGITVAFNPHVQCIHWVLQERGAPLSNNGCHKITPVF